MPERTQPPNFDFFTERDAGDEAEPPALEYTAPGLPALAYPLRQNDAADEVERLTAQLEAARRVWNEVRYSLILENAHERRLAFIEVKEALEMLGAALGMV